VNPVRILALVAKDFRMGPRSPVYLWILMLPVFVTFLVQVVFLTLVEPRARMAVADLGGSAIPEAFEKLEGIDVTRAEDEAEVRDLVVNHDADAGLVLGEGFDASVRSGARPPLGLFISGESVAMNRLVLVSSTMDLVRHVENRPDPVEVEVKTLGKDDGWSLKDLFLLSVVMFVLLVTGLFLPAFLIVEEREHGTLQALLVTPVRLSEVLLAKAVIGFVVALSMALATLWVNGLLRAEPVALIATLVVATLTCNGIGLIYATVARDVKTLYSLSKTLNPLILGPLLFLFFPSWPQWPAMLFPTYWFIDPLYRIAIGGAGLADVGWKLAIALAFCAVMTVPIAALGTRMRAGLSAE
jgi:ABC-2 type transport system permease protein